MKPLRQSFITVLVQKGHKSNKNKALGWVTATHVHSLVPGTLTRGEGEMEKRRTPSHMWPGGGVHADGGPKTHCLFCRVHVKGLVGLGRKYLIGEQAQDVNTREKEAAVICLHWKPQQV